MRRPRPEIALDSETVGVREKWSLSSRCVLRAVLWDV